MRRPTARSPRVQPARVGSRTAATGHRTERSERELSELLLAGEKQALQLIVEGAPLQAVLTALVRLIEAQSADELLASVLLLDRDGVHLRHGAAPSLPDAYCRAIDGIASGPSVGSCGTAAYRGEPVLVQDIASDPLWADFRDLALGHGLRACWSTPIVSSAGEVLGTFALYYRVPRGPSERDRQLVEIVTRTATIAIERERADAEREQLLERERAARAAAEATARALTEKEQELRDFVEHAALGLHWVGSDGRILWANQAELDLLGYTREEYIGHHITEFHADPPVIDDILRRLAGKETLQNYEARLRCKDGSIKWVHITSNVRWDGDTFVNTRCFTRDVTERKRAEQRLTIQYAVTRLLAEVATLEEAGGEILRAIGETIGWSVGTLWRVDRAAQVLRCVDVWRQPGTDVAAFEAATRQRSFERGIGLPGRVWASGQPAWVPDVVEDDNFPRAAVAARVGLHTALSIPIRLSEEVLGVLEFFGLDSRPPDGALLEMIAAVGSQVAQFIERKRAEEERAALLARERRQAERLAFLSEAGAALVASLDEGEILRCLADLAVPALADCCFFDAVTPDGGVQRTAWRHSDPAQQTLFDAVYRAAPPRTLEAHPVAQALRTGSPVLVPDVDDAWLQQAATSPEHLVRLRALGFHSLLAVPLVVEGRAVGALTFCYTPWSGRRYDEADLALAVELGRRAALAVVHARLHAETRAAREEAEAALRARNEFLSIASHELRNPVAGLKGTAQLLRRSRERGRLDAERLDRYLTSLERTSAHLATLTEDLLDVSRLQRGGLPLRPQPTDLAALVREAVARQQAHADGRRLRLDQAGAPCPVVVDPDRIEQIVTNLLDNAVKYSPDGGDVEVALARDGAGALLRVRDAGIGLPPGTTEKIFEPFGRAPNAAERNLPGLGLGLYVCRRIAAQHGGRLWAESAGEGQGTTLSLWLPLEADPPAVD